MHRIFSFPVDLEAMKYLRDGLFHAVSVGPFEAEIPFEIIGGEFNTTAVVL